MLLGLFNRPRKREIYRYHDGQRTRGADPIEVLRKMGNHEKFVFEKHVAECASPEPAISEPAAEISIAATRDIFGIKPWSDETESGLTELETLAVLNGFCEFIDGLKKNGNGQPT